jgi:hypothetical protein
MHVQARDITIMGWLLIFCNQVNGKLVWNVDKNWMIVVECFKEKGFSWGGDWKGKLKDYPHLEKRLTTGKNYWQGIRPGKKMLMDMWIYHKLTLHGMRSLFGFSP